jgi:tetratricopeptide (TPR) repeat protein
VTFERFRKLTGAIFILILLPRFAAGQTQARPDTPQIPVASVYGQVQDASGNPLAGAEVFAQPVAQATNPVENVRSTHTNAQGAYIFSQLPVGAYTLRAQMVGKGAATLQSAVDLVPYQVKRIDLVLVTDGVSPPPAKPESIAKPPAFFDEPQFTVAGVTAATNSGGHGSDTVLRSSDALVKATVSLGKNADVEAALSKSSLAGDGKPEDPREAAVLRQRREEIETELRQESGKAITDATPRVGTANDSTSDPLARLKQSELRHELAQIAEKLGDPLQAVREYQRASELTPTETNLFDWGSELLAHRALEPATEVFTRGNQLYPKSARMLIGLGVSLYAQGSYDRAAQYLANASDLAPADPTPYLFMGKMQSVELEPSKDTSERLARFCRRKPDNALANYYFAVSLWKFRAQAAAASEIVDMQVETLLQKAVQLDSRLGVAYLQLGVLYATRDDYAHAIPAYQRAIEASPELDEAHYRLAQAYRRTGDEVKAKQELELHEQLSKRAKEKAEHERGEIQQFVISLRDKKSNSKEP